MRRAAAALLLALFVGSAAAQPPPRLPVLTVAYAEYSADRRNESPILGFLTDGTGHARVIVGAGHGVIMFMTVDGHGYLVIEDGRGERVGRQEQMLELMAADEGDWRRLGLALGRQRIEIVPRGTETVLGIAGQVYAITLIEEGRRSPPFEIVISADPRLAGTGREMLRVYDLLRAPLIGLNGREPQPYTAFRALLARGTPIRIGRHYRLREFGWRESPGEAFVLPGPVLERAAFVAVLRRQLLRAPGSDRAADVPPEDVWNDTVVDEAAVNAAANEAMQAASDAANAMMEAAANAANAMEIANESDDLNAANPD